MNKKPTTDPVLLGFILAGAICLISPGPLHGQAAPGPLSGAQPAPPGQAPSQPQAQPKLPPRQNILGSWKLNRDESDNPQRRSQGSNGGNGGNDPNGGNGPYGGRGRMGGGWPYPGGGGGPYGGPRGSNGGGGNDQEREGMRDLMRHASSLTFSQKDKEFDLTDDRGRKRAFFTDGRKLHRSKDESYEELSAHGDA